MPATLSWGIYGENLIPSDAAPRGTITVASGEHVGGMLISLDPNQPAPDYSSTNPKPDISEVRLILTQPSRPTSLDLFRRRADVCGVLSRAWRYWVT